MTELKSAACIRRYPGNPVLAAKDVPYEALLIFNAGVTNFQGRYVMVFRNDYGQHPSTPHPRHTNMGLAFSDDGVHWEVQPKPCFDLRDGEIRRGYDPRLTVIDGRCYHVLRRRHPPRRARRDRRDRRLRAFRDPQPERARQPQHGALPGARRRQVRAPGAAFPGLRPRRGRPLRHLVLRFARPALLGQLPTGAGGRGCALRQRQDRPGAPPVRTERLADPLPRRGPGPDPRQERLGRRVAEALLRRHHAARPGRALAR